MTWKTKHDCPSELTAIGIEYFHGITSSEVGIVHVQEERRVVGLLEFEDEFVIRARQLGARES